MKKAISIMLCVLMLTAVLPVFAEETCEHIFGEWQVYTQADCTHTGSDKRSCTLCGTEELRAIDIDPTAHCGQTELANEKAGSCTEEGYTGDLICTACNGIAEAGHVIPAEGHFFSQWEAETPASCTQKGTETRFCSVCGEKESRETEVALDNHSGETEIRGAIEPTLTTAGATGETVCLSCGRVIEESRPAYAAHLLGDVDGDEKVSVSDARLILRNSVNLSSIEALYASFADFDGNNAILVSDARACLRTAVQLEEEKTVNYLVTATIEPSCLSAGTAKYYDGTEEHTIALPKGTHNFVQTETVNATCTTDGKTVYKCSKCDAENSSVIRATGHKAADATCTAPSVCSVCGAELSPALGHDMLPATCTAPSTCSRCGITEGEAAGHYYEPATYEKPATCIRCGGTVGDVLGVAYTSKGYKITTTPDGFTYIEGILIVNKTYSIPSSYNPGGLTAECSAAFYRMVNAAASQGISLWVQSGFRSYSTQSALYTRYCNSDGQAAADRYSARPGYSEHQTGLAIDVNSVLNSFKDTAAGKWLAAHCAEYGFILRYPSGKESKTGYIYEPWHIRYIGDVELAKAITNSGLCLEEYFGITSVYEY